MVGESDFIFLFFKIDLNFVLTSFFSSYTENKFTADENAEFKHFKMTHEGCVLCEKKKKTFDNLNKYYF